MVTMDKQFFLQRAAFVRMVERTKKHEQRMADLGVERPEPIHRTEETVSRCKIVKSGTIYELYEYERGVSVGKKRGGRKKAEEAPSIREDANRRASMRAACNKFRRLVNANFQTSAKFVTLTFADAWSITGRMQLEAGSYGSEDDGHQPGAEVESPQEGTAGDRRSSGGRVQEGDIGMRPIVRGSDWLTPSGDSPENGNGRPPLGVDARQPVDGTSIDEGREGELQNGSDAGRGRKTNEEQERRTTDENDRSMGETCSRSEGGAESRRACTGPSEKRKEQPWLRPIDIRDVTQTRAAFESFVKRLRRLVAAKHGGQGDFKYIMVTEFQDENRAGVVHFHLIADLPYIPHAELEEKWGWGFVGVNFVDDVGKVGKYMTKYLQKSFGDVRLKRMKAYLPSKGLLQPLDIHGEEAQQVAMWLAKGKRKRVYENVYPSEWCGRIHYIEYNTDGTKTKNKTNIKEGNRKTPSNDIQ